LDAVVERARSVGCDKLIVTGSDVKESRKAIELAKKYRLLPSRHFTHNVIHKPRLTSLPAGTIYATVGVHPCQCSQFAKTATSASTLLSSLRSLALSAKASSHAVAFGEFGLDYDRLSHCDKETQLKYFEAQLDIAVEVQLPLFLHSRAAHDDFLRMLSEREDRLPKRGVVHSFTGTREEMLELVSHGWDIGVNGCSLKTAENCDVVKAIPLDRLQLETDGPWCEMRPGHAGSAFAKDLGFEENHGSPWKWVKKEKWVEGALVKGRNEPCLIEKVAWAVAGIKGVSVEEVAEKAWGNTVRMFGLGVDLKAEEADGKVS
jgi:TatD DNase family protein